MARKGLPTLIRLAKFEVDEKRRALTILQTREDSLLAAMAAAQEEMAREQQVAAADPEAAGFLFGAYAAAWLARRANMERSLAALRKEIEKARDELAEAFRRQKTYEITQANRERRAREEADRKEQATLDEIGLNLYRRRDREDG